jgi:flagellar basal-body rod protein FlgF
MTAAMQRGLYIAAAGMVSEMARQDLIANNLSNASTPGYKADRAAQRSFGDLMLVNTATGAPVGPLGLGSRIERQVTDMAPAPLRETGEPLDFAIQGDGFFAVQTARGIRYTRNGQFGRAADGSVVDQQGNRVMGQNGAPVRVAAGGTVDPARIGVFAVPNARKVGDGLFQGAAAGRGAGQVRSGALEASGSDPARTMVDMMASLRAFEAGQKVIATIDSTLGKAANQVGGL